MLVFAYHGRVGHIRSDKQSRDKLDIGKKDAGLLRGADMTLKHIVILMTLALAVAGCKTNNMPVPPQFQASAYAPLSLNARSLDIISNWVMPLTDPYQEHLLQPNPSDVLTDWASRVLLPAGGSGELVLDISEASVTITDLPKSEKFLDTFNDQQESLVRVTYAAVLMWIQPVGGQQALVEVRASSSQSLAESSRPVDYDVAIQETTLAALAEMDMKLRAEIATINGLVLP